MTYAVTQIPGLLVFAVNSDRSLIPFLSHVLVRSAVLEGPDAVAAILGEYNTTARELLSRFDSQPVGPEDVVTALDAMKSNYLLDRIHKKIASLQKSDNRLPPMI